MRKGSGSHGRGTVRADTTSGSDPARRPNRMPGRRPRGRCQRACQARRGCLGRGQRRRPPPRAGDLPSPRPHREPRARREPNREPNRAGGRAWAVANRDRGPWVGWSRDQAARRGERLPPRASRGRDPALPIRRRDRTRATGRLRRARRGSPRRGRDQARSSDVRRPRCQMPNDPRLGLGRERGRQDRGALSPRRSAARLMRSGRPARPPDERRLLAPRSA